MRILVLGGTRFIGPYIVRELARAGHEVTVFHRGTHKPEFPASVRHIHGAFAEFDKYVAELRQFDPQVVLDTAAFRGEEGGRVLAFAGVAQRSVLLSSCDVYRAFGRLLRTESGEPDPVPLTEDSPLREKLTAAGEAYNKTAVEREARADPRLPCTILRLPATHGPGDWQHRLFDYAKRMADKRPAILVDQNIASWHWARGYVANIAHAVALAVTNDRAAGRIYNVADAQQYSELAWVGRIADVMKYKGRIVAAPTELLPLSLRANIDSRQQMILDTSRIRNELGYEEVIEEEAALSATIEWELANPPPKKDGDFDYAAEDAILSAIRQ